MIAEKEKPVSLVLVNIGNTNTGLATWFDDKRSDADQVATDAFDDLMACVKRLWDELPTGSLPTVVVSSVCPDVLTRLRQACEQNGIGPVLAIGEELEPPIGIDVEEPLKVGSDRLCVAAAAYEKVRGACVVADFGTALTIDLVADNGVFLGGTIVPGMQLAARALHEHTALLPMVEIGAPTETLGKNTVQAIRNGIFAMTCGALREIAERYATEIGKWPPLIATGGDAEVIGKACDFVDGVLPDLCLDGLVLAYRQWHAAATE